tara:strand:- start:41657 stop:41917 length:261 start_codon:yes stop_codon:yes gene_type:complete
MSGNLTLESLEKARALMGPPMRHVWGVAAPPRVYEELRKEFSKLGGTPFKGIDIIIDPRESNASAYYDRNLWLERVKEQNKWEAQR